MSTIKYVTALFKDGADELTPIARKPTNDDLKRLRKLLINLLQDVKIPRVTDAEGLLTTKADYKAAHSDSTFDHLNPPLDTYDPANPSDAMTTDRMQAKRELTEELCRQFLFGLHAIGCRGVGRILRIVCIMRRVEAVEGTVGVGCLVVGLGG